MWILMPATMCVLYLLSLVTIVAGLGLPDEDYEYAAAI